MTAWTSNGWISSDCRNDWCDECTDPDCGCVCHAAEDDDIDYLWDDE